MQLKVFALENPGRSVSALLSEAGLATFTPFSTRTGLKYVHSYLRNAGTVTLICILIASGAAWHRPSFAHWPNIPRETEAPHPGYVVHTIDRLTLIADVSEENPAEDVAVGEHCLLACNANFYSDDLAARLAEHVLVDTPSATSQCGALFWILKLMLMHRSHRIRRAERFRVACCRFGQYAYFISFNLDTGNTAAATAPCELRLAAPAPPLAGLFELHD